MTKALGMLLLMIGIGAIAFANDPPAPEIDPGTGTSALALLSGGLLVMRGSRKS